MAGADPRVLQEPSVPGADGRWIPGCRLAAVDAAVRGIRLRCGEAGQAECRPGHGVARLGLPAARGWPRHFCCGTDRPGVEVELELIFFAVWRGEMFLFFF